MSMIPSISEDLARRLIREAYGPWREPELPIEPWMIKAVQVAYQRGRYDEASAETFAMAMD